MRVRSADALGTGERGSATGDADTPSDILPDRIIDHAVQGTAGRGRRAVDDEDAAIESMTTDTAETDEDVEREIDDDNADAHR